MWKDYSVSYIKNNRSSSISIMVAAFISALFLSLLCCLFYNVWQYDRQQIILEEGEWHARITGTLDEEALAAIETFGNVKMAVINEKLTKDQEAVVDICLFNPRTIYRDMPLLAERAGVGTDAITFHDLLLSRYLIQNPQDNTPALLLPFYLFLLFTAALALVLIIRNAFAVTMNARVHQFGIFSSIGATPGQIRLCLMQEAAALCLMPVLAGSLIGIAFTYGIIQAVNALAGEMAGRHRAVFQYHFLIFAGTVLVTALTVFFSAWLPARKLSRITPLEAIKNGGDFRNVRRKQARILSLFFGVEGELAGVSLKARSKALRTTMLSLTLSFFVFTLFLNFTAFSRLSVYETSFSKYQDYWDIMAVFSDTPIAEFKDLEDVAALENVESAVLYQKADAYTRIPSARQSDALLALGGISAIDGEAVSADGDEYLVRMPLVILDDAGFLEYCSQVDVEPRADGGIILNRIWDSHHSNFRNRSYVPFIKETEDRILLGSRGEESSVEIPVLAYTEEPPVLWEQYDDYTLVQVIPLSLWKTFSEKINTVDTDTCLRILTVDDSRLNEDMAVIQGMLEREYSMEIHNRVQDMVIDDQMWRGFHLFMSAGCVLLAVIGIASIFSHTLGFVCQRKREFARYLSIGVTPEGIKKILWIEALTIAGKPILTTLPLTALFMVIIIKASYMEVSRFLPVMPILPIVIYMAAVFFFIGLAYYTGGKRLLRCDLSEALREDAVL